MTPILAAEGVQFSYGRQTVLAGVTLEVHPGEIIALAGPNGAGKTTLLKLLASLLVPHVGRIAGLARGPRSVAYLAQSEELPSDWSVREVVELGRMPYVGLWRSPTVNDERVVQRAMECTEVLHLSGRMASALSGGERQRVGLARALAQEPLVLLLDEPTVHLDLRHQVALFATLRAEAARGVAVVIVVHDLGFAAQADRCVLLSGGRVRADGPPARVLCPDLLREVYEVDVDVMRSADGRVVIAPRPSSKTEESGTHRSEKSQWNHGVSS